jgi:hypothetical protein
LTIFPTIFPFEMTRATLHGHAAGGLSPTYQAWHNMKRRCLDEKNHRYQNYGGRGIKLCYQWRSFDAFLLDMGVKPEGMTLERKDVNGDYTPSNCVWATHKEQANNKTSNRHLTHDGLTFTTSQWADRTGISHVTLRMRLHRGWDVARALTQRVRGA